MFVQNVTCHFRILKGPYDILQRPINQKRSLNVIHVVLEIRNFPNLDFCNKVGLLILLLRLCLPLFQYSQEAGDHLQDKRKIV